MRKFLFEKKLSFILAPTAAASFFFARITALLLFKISSDRKEKDRAKGGLGSSKKWTFYCSSKNRAQCIILCRINSQSLNFRRLVKIDHPVYPKFVAPHAKIGAPKCVC